MPPDASTRNKEDVELLIETALKDSEALISGMESEAPRVEKSLKDIEVAVDEIWRLLIESEVKNPHSRFLAAYYALMDSVRLFRTTLIRSERGSKAYSRAKSLGDELISSANDDERFKKELEKLQVRNEKINYTEQLVRSRLSSIEETLNLVSDILLTTQAERYNKTMFRVTVFGALIAGFGVPAAIITILAGLSQLGILHL
jgi:hypothetical protein